MLTKYGTGNIIVMIVTGLALIVGGFLVSNNIVKYLLILPGLILIIFTFVFFRDPVRKVPEKAINDARYVVSPADGVVVNIEEIEEPLYMKKNVKRLSIFLSPLDVHVNRAPVTGEVEFYKYFPGKYLVAYHPKSSELNEQSKIGVMTDFGKVLFTQIVGVVARRLVCDLNVGDKIRVGEKFGMMKFGSRMDVYMETDTEILVKKDQRVVAGETIIAVLNDKNSKD
jgi:phosphatidylserine decarboxylase